MSTTSGEIIVQRFRVETLAGTGATGSVYRALDLRTGAPVALKIVAARSPLDAARCAGAASALLASSHPAIVGHVAHGAMDTGEYFLAMEWVEGESLDVRIRRMPLTLLEAARLGARLADALATAHRAGVIHRDVKPSNVILEGGRADAPKLIDFGIAWDHAADAGAPPGGLAGTPGYMAPEQARGSADLDARADVFSLGCVVFASVTGWPPFDAPDVLTVLAKLAVDQPPRLRERAPLVPGELDALVARMLARDRTARPTMTETAAALTEIGEALERAGAGDSRPVADQLELRSSPFVGRDREVALVGRLFEECLRLQASRATLVVAEPGAGKTRLGEELAMLLRRDRRRPQPLVLLGGGDAMVADSPLSTIARPVRQAAGIEWGDSLEARRDKLRARVEALGRQDAPRIAAFLGEIVDAPFAAEQDGQEAARVGAARADPRLMADQVSRAFEDWVEAETSRQPVVLLLDDVHWADPASIQLVDSALGVLQGRPFFVVGLARPSVHTRFPRLWSTRQLTTTTLPPLSRHASSRIVEHALGPDVPPGVVDLLSDSAEGNALRLHELVRAAAEGRDLERSDLATLVEARILRASTASQRVLRVASIFGTAFSAEGVRALLPSSPRTGVPGSLEELVRHGLIERHESREQASSRFTFRHDTIREAAYRGLTEEDRRVGHRLAAQHLATPDDAARATDPSLVAGHLERGGDARGAIGWYAMAAERARKGSELDLAIAHVESAVRCGARDTDLGALRVIEAEALVSRGDTEAARDRALAAMRALPRGSDGWFTAAGIVAEFYGTMERLDSIADDLARESAGGPVGPPAVVAACKAISSLVATARYPSAELLFHILERRAPGCDSVPRVRASLLHVRSVRALDRGDLVGYVLARREASALFDEMGGAQGAANSRSNLGYGYAELGLYERAAESLRAALRAAQRWGFERVAANARQNLGNVLARSGSLDDALRVELEAVDAYVSRRELRMEAAARVYLSQILLARGCPDDAVREAKKGLDIVLSPTLRAEALAATANAYLAVGRPHDALAAATEAMALLDGLGGNAFGEARWRLVHAEALRAGGAREAAGQAIAAARDRVLERAAGIHEERWRQAFLVDVRENARTLSLARAWEDERG